MIFNTFFNISLFKNILKYLENPKKMQFIIIIKKIKNKIKFVKKKDIFKDTFL